MTRGVTPQEETAILERRKLTADLYCSGLAQHEIAAKIGVSQGTISLDLKYIRDNWLAQALVDFDMGRAVELAKIDHLEAVSWDAWHRSCRPAEISKRVIDKAMRSQGKPVKGQPTPPPKMVVTGTKDEVTTRQQVGDDRFLGRVAWCIETRLKLMGLLQEAKAPVNVIQINWGEMTGRELERVNPVEAKLAQALPPPRPEKPPVNKDGTPKLEPFQTAVPPPPPRNGAKGNGQAG